MANTNINTLPIDILLEIFLHLSDIRHLFSLTSTSKHIHTAFHSRRTLILSRVFERQISHLLLRLQTLYPASQHGSPGAVYTSQILQIARSVEHAIEQYSDNTNNNVEDILTLDAAAWKAFKVFDRRAGVLGLVGERSISRCIALDRCDLALQRAKEIWDLVGDEEGQGQGRDLSLEQEREAKRLILRFAAVFREGGWRREADELVGCCCRSASASASASAHNMFLRDSLVPARMESSWSWNSARCDAVGHESEGVANLRQSQLLEVATRMDRRGNESVDVHLRDVAWISSHRTRCEDLGWVGQASNVCGRYEWLVGTNLVMNV